MVDLQYRCRLVFFSLGDCWRYLRDCSVECKGACPLNSASHLPRDCPAFLRKQKPANQVSAVMTIDSGASDFFVNSSFRSSLSNFRQAPAPMPVTMPNGAIERLQHCGSFKDYDVMYAPNFRSSLLSVSKFCDRKNVFLFTDSKAYGVSINSCNARFLDQFISVSQDVVRTYLFPFSSVNYEINY